MSADGIQVEPVPVIKEELEHDICHIIAEDDVFHDPAAIKIEQISIEGLSPAVKKETAVKEETDDFQVHGEEIAIKDELPGVLNNLVKKIEFEEEYGESCFPDRSNAEDFHPIENQFSSSASFMYCTQSDMVHSRLSETETLPSKCCKTNHRSCKSKKGNRKLFSCSVCLKSFHKNKYLLRHAIMHSNEKLFRCNVCSKEFNRKANLIQHFGTHFHDNTFKCNICSKAFHRYWHLKEHMKTHNDEKLYQCNVCSETFHEGSELIEHFKSHKIQKAIKCAVRLKSGTAWSEERKKAHSEKMKEAWRLKKSQVDASRSALVNYTK